MLLEGECIPADAIEARRWALAAAEQGIPAAMTRVGMIYHNAIGVERDPGVAAMWWEKAALRKDADAQAMLGAACLLGAGVAPAPATVSGEPHPLGPLGNWEGRMPSYARRRDRARRGREHRVERPAAMKLRDVAKLVLAALHRWRTLSCGFEDEDDVARMVAREFGEVARLVGVRG